MVIPKEDVVSEVVLKQPSKDSYGYKRDFRTALPQLLAVSVKNLVLLGYGMTLGFPTILIAALRYPVGFERPPLNDVQVSWISSLNLMTVPIGCALSGVVTTPLGRRLAMQVLNVPFVATWIIFYVSTEVWYLYLALFVTGITGGLLEAPVLTYVAEITQPHLRGALTATSSMCIIIGVFTQFLFGLFLHWRKIALTNIIFPVLALIALCFVPESPHWLVSRNNFKDARKSLQWLRGWTSPEAVEEELLDIEELFKKKKGQVEHKETVKEKLSPYIKRSFLVPFFLVSYSFFVGHFSGMTTLQTYAVSIFQMLRAPIDKYYATLILGLLQIAGSAICVVLVHYTGKRPLTILSTLGAGVCCLFISGYEGYIQAFQHQANSTDADSTSIFLKQVDPEPLNNPLSWIPTTCLLLLALITHTGIRLLPWILIGEVFNAKTRSVAAGLASAVGYIFGFLTNKIFITMIDHLSIWGTYGVYGTVCLTGCVAFYYILPETEGKKLNEIQDHFAGIRKLTNDVYRSKKRPDKELSTMEKATANPAVVGDCSKL